MEIVKDLLGGSKPQSIEVHYNGTIDADSVTKRYKGSLVKMVDINDADEGYFFTWGGGTTALENIAGILEEEQEITGNYLPTHATLGQRTRKVLPIFPSTIIRAEYGIYDAAGGVAYATGHAGSAGNTTFEPSAMGTADYMTGGWFYCINGSNAGYLHYIETDDGSSCTVLGTALANAVVAADDILVIQPSCTRGLDFDDTYTGLKSEFDSGSWHLCVQGLMTYIRAPGVAMQKLDRNKHDGKKISNAKFFHDFVFTGGGDVAGGTPNLIWTRGTAAA